MVGVDGLEPTIPYGDRFTVWCNSHYATPPMFLGADGGIRTPDPLITNQLLWPTELHRHIFIFWSIIERTVIVFPLFGCANV
jgi:hypothetical protein